MLRRAHFVGLTSLPDSNSSFHLFIYFSLFFIHITMEASIEGISMIEEWINWTPRAVCPSKGKPELLWRPTQKEQISIWNHPRSDTGPVLCLLCPENQLRATGRASAALLCFSSPALVWTGRGASQRPCLHVAKTNPNNWSERFALAPILFTNHGVSGFPKWIFFYFFFLLTPISWSEWFSLIHSVCIYTQKKPWNGPAHPTTEALSRTLKSRNAGNMWDFSTTLQEGLGPSCSIKLLSTVPVNNC